MKIKPSHLRTTPRGNVCTPESVWISDCGFMAKKSVLDDKAIAYWEKRPCSIRCVDDAMCEGEIDSWRCNSSVVDDWEVRPATDCERLKHDRAVIDGWCFNAKAAAALKSVSTLVGLQVSGRRARLLFLDGNAKPIALLMAENLQGETTT